MKILITSDWYKPAINGVVASILNLKKGLEERGHEVRVITLSPTVHSYVDGDVTYIGAINAGKVYPGARLRSALANPLVNDLIKWKPDIVHSNCEMSTFFIAMRIAKKTGAPLVHTYHTVYEDYTHYFSPSKRVGKKIVKGLSRLMAEHTDTVIVPSVKVLNILKRYEIETPIAVVPTGIDQERFSPESGFNVEEMLRECGVPEGNEVAISIGRLAKEKNTEELIEYMKAFSGDRVTLLIIGDGPYRKNLEKIAAESGVPKDQIIFYGAVPPAEVGKYYHLGNIFVSASTSETQGLTYFEALSCGLPVLARRDDCLDGVVEDGVNGWQFDDAVGFEKYLRKYITDRECHAAMREAALETGEKFSVASFAKNMEDIYKELLEEPGAGRPPKSRANRLKIHVKATYRKLKRVPGVKTAGKVVSRIHDMI